MKKTRSFDAPNCGEAPFFEIRVAFPPAAGTM